MTTQNEMPAKIYLIQPHDCDETEVIWTTDPDCYDGAEAHKYIRADLTFGNETDFITKKTDLTQPAGDVGEALIGLNKLHFNKPSGCPEDIGDDDGVDLEQLDSWFNTHYHTIKRALSQQPIDIGAITPITTHAPFCHSQLPEGLSGDCTCKTFARLTAPTEKVDVDALWFEMTKNMGDENKIRIVRMTIDHLASRGYLRTNKEKNHE